MWYFAGMALMQNMVLCLSYFDKEFSAGWEHWLLAKFKIEDFFINICTDKTLKELKIYYLRLNQAQTLFEKWHLAQIYCNIISTHEQAAC